jgi:hypothetical protein
MKMSVSVACLVISLCALKAQANASVNYKVHNSKPTKDVSIQIVSFDAVPGLNSNAIRKLNAALINVSNSFKNEAKECSAAAQGHPWGYELSIEKVLLSKKYLSVVFSKSTVCAGSPDIEKEARVFSLPSGDFVPARTLFKQIFPDSKPITTISPNKEIIRLSKEMTEAMISDSKEILKNYDKQCEFYLKNTSYRIWIDGANLILFPEFQQPESICQKEYLIQVEN